ncbi:MAG: ectoine hydroxylase, partial [Pseudomonadota bacterium]|nr:ectoine hydroxylase [Pseudomonadota bacterium]
MQDVYPSRHADVAEFLPRLDPVVHSQWREDA